MPFSCIASTIYGIRCSKTLTLIFAPRTNITKITRFEIISTKSTSFIVFIVTLIGCYTIFHCGATSAITHIVCKFSKIEISILFGFDFFFGKIFVGTIWRKSTKCFSELLRNYLLINKALIFRVLFFFFLIFFWDFCDKLIFCDSFKNAIIYAWNRKFFVFICDFSIGFC